MSSRDAKALVEAVRQIKAEIGEYNRPPSETAASYDQPILPRTLVTKTRRHYLVVVVDQINSSYTHANYDACAVMLRRLLETLVIGAFENHQIEHRIKDGNGEFVTLDKCIDAALNEKTWNLTRTTKNGLKQFKFVGDHSAHSRTYTAHRQDIDRIANDFRVFVEEFLTLAGLR